MKNLIDYISSLIGEKIIHHKPISGGDISSAFLVKTSKNYYFLKVNSKKSALAMFLSEKKGLAAISKTRTIATPKVYHCELFEHSAFILLEYIESKTPTSKDFETFAFQLARLHKNTTSKFGCNFDNYIGSLPQSNRRHQNWTTFYLEERIFPQLELAKSKHLLATNDIPQKQQMYYVCQELFQNITPSLLHGDLWSGNYLINNDGTPYLIDPSVYYGHNEIDIAMSKLFGGFDPSFYQTYQEYFPISEQTNARISLYQLYYLLVHLNLFGNSYVGSVKNILSKYF